MIKPELLRVILLGACFQSALLLIAPASAEGQRMREPRAGRMHLAPAAKAPREHRSARVHDGFYLRAGVGAGGLWTDILDRGERDDRFDLEGSGFNLAADLLVGLSPADGFALGGGLLWGAGPTELSGNGEDTKSTLGLLTVGPFFDAFPNSRRGWHLGALAGYAGHSISDHPSDITFSHGFGGAAWFGHDFWVADEISAGLMLRFNGAITSSSKGTEQLNLSSTGLTLLLTAVYH